MRPLDRSIDHRTLRSLVDAGAAINAEVIGQAGAWGVVINYGRASQTLAAARGAPRTFRNFSTLAGYLKELGITECKVNLAEYEPGAKQDQRSVTASQRMRAAHDAVAHDKWFREHVGKAFDEARSPDAEPSIPQAVAKANMAKQRAELRAQIAKAK